MRAALLTEFGKPLELVEIPVPSPAAGEVLIRTRASGMCRTDLKIAKGFMATVELPRVLGHEVAGEVAAVGAGVDGALVGSRVTSLVDLTCGECEYCRDPASSYCANLRRVGIETDGGHAEFLCVPAANLISLPDSIPFDVASALPDAIGTTYRAIHTRGRVRAGQTVVIYGLGGLGLSGVQIAATAGANVIAVSRTPERRELAASLGASTLLDPNEDDLVESVRRATGGHGADLFVDLVGIEGSVEKAVRCCRKGGRVVVVGYLVPTFEVTTYHLLANEIEILGSRSITREEMQRVVELVADGVLSPVIAENLPLDLVNDTYRRLSEGEITGRPVIVFP
jgi:2-desacetyl-2-hydroxyethyl bacteriochlorophyllide A dehydrogenase